ncbi:MULTISPECIES: helix-turn-helix domain-containing protein [Brenneria]|uniref:helix-turn-helix domain-containing protein n=1 Tax=Brenneria TaxID=71655 RepID=UPI00351008EE
MQHYSKINNNGGVMDQIQAMRIFVRIAELGSFSRAAEMLSLPRRIRADSGAAPQFAALAGQRRTG